ncbi:MAG: GTPase HflX [Opitutae bacterium]|nr:GTPase HflX [Opitutae bacterium]|tara:strand:+ start:30892 stop:32178 length:1287 start_codon:yes stop_codon:yes gene_type:complete
MFEVKEKPRLVERAYLLSVILRETERSEAESLLNELEELVSNLGIEIVCKHVVRTRKTFPGHLIGKGKFEQLLKDVQSQNCDVIIFDNEISPSQQRNWEEASNVLVIDRHEVILDVFAERAQTKEASLQVRLARLEYSLPRMRRAWTHLDRQRGGGVTQRGEGEAQIELDQRMLRDKIAKTKREIVQVATRRETSRKKRHRIPLPTLALVGYTNAGKSTLLNALCGSTVLAANKLFATLDPTSRKTVLPCGKTIILTDTVGFIRKLPHRLVDAFRATLEEALVSDFLVHVVDLSNPDFEEQMETTIEVLSELGAQEKTILTVFNKIDLDGTTTNRMRANVLCEDANFISSHTGKGLINLHQKIEFLIEGKMETKRFLIPHRHYSIISRIRKEGCLKSEEVTEVGILVEAFPQGKLAKELKKYANYEKK